ncbi:MAG: META domain-containing protein [Alphaproteobacteria bacterium]|nr:META domain-containing protein [Alphaproteobacteria bacterium]
MVWRILILVVLLVMVPFGAIAAEIKGSALYRERIAMPPEALFLARVFDVSDNDLTELGRHEGVGDAGPPYEFSIALDDARISQNARLTIRAEVILKDRPQFVAERALDSPNQDGLMLIMKRPADKAAALRNTFWRLDQIGQAPVPGGVTQTEPHLILEAGAEGAFSATVGCNQMRGQVAIDGAALTFSPGATTMMACPEPLGTLEQAFSQSLAEVASFRIEGETLFLLDEKGRVQAKFTAVH